MIVLNQYRDKWLGEKFDEVIGFYPREFYCLDNFSSFKVFYENYLYATVEEAYQASKFIGFAPEVVKLIQNCYSAHDSKKIARRHIDKIRADWLEVNLTIMEELLRLKLAQNPYIEEELLKTLDYQLVEDSPYDDYWGWGSNRDGQNKLGILWMKLRSEIRKKHNMKLNADSLGMLESGEKEVEYRLNDEKRQQLRVGDIITFTKLSDEDKTLSVIITDLKKYKTLLEMYTASFDQYLSKNYITPKEAVEATDYYSDEEIEKHGCLAIHIKKINER